MFWTEKRREVIMKAHLDGSEPTTLVTTDVGSSGGLHMCKHHIFIYATDLGTSFLSILLYKTYVHERVYLCVHTPPN